MGHWRVSVEQADTRLAPPGADVLVTTGDSPYDSLGSLCQRYEEAD